jgi:penicillin-binding protein 2
MHRRSNIKNDFSFEKTKSNSIKLIREEPDWFDDMLSYSLTGNKTRINKEFLSPAIDFYRLKMCLFVVLAGFLILSSKMFYLQVVKGDYYRAIAEENRIRVQTTKASRGLIYDRNNIPLVQNSPNFVYSIVHGDLPKEKSKREEIINKIAGLSNLSAEAIHEAIDPYPLLYYQPIIIKENVTQEEAIKLKIASIDLAGIILEIDTRRDYLNKPTDATKVLSLSHVLGYVGKISKEELDKKSDEYEANDYLGKSGLELSWEDALRGSDGKKQIEVDAFGKEKRIITEEISHPGKNLILSLDFNLQKKCEDVLNSYLKKFNKKRGSVIVMNPNNGEILSLVSLPAFDNNLFTKGLSNKEYQNLIGNLDQPLFNRSIKGEYPSGSTIKPIMASAALEEKIITEKTAFWSTGGIWYNQWFFPDWRAGGHGLTDVKKAIAESINTFFYIIGGGYKDFIGLGPNKIAEYARLFGLGEKLRIDLPGESSGLMPTPEWKEETRNQAWYIGDTYHMSIGQGDVLVTPLQMAASTAVFANRGILYKPHLVKEIVDPETGKKEEIGSTTIRSNFISSQTIDIVRRGMRQTITSGSGRSLLDLPVAVAGKTGTAQWRNDRPPHAWFIGFAPFEKPEIVVMVMIEEGEEGSVIATQAAKEIFNWYFTVK